MSVVVVVLPFDPVMATIWPCRNCAPSSSSPIIGIPNVRTVAQLGSIRRHARRDDDQILTAEGQQPVASCLDHDACVEQRGKFRNQSRRPDITDRHLRSTGLEKASSCDAALAEANYEYTLVF